MKMLHNALLWLVMMPSGAMLALGGCRDTGSSSEAPKRAAVVTVLLDLSGSNPLTNGGPYMDAAIKRAGQVILEHKLGDSVRIVPLGSRTVERSVEAFMLASGRQRKLPVVRRQAEAKLRNLLTQARIAGGDGTTNILHTLRNANITCTPRSSIVILSDGLEQSESYSTVATFAEGKPIKLPPPDGPYLKNCSVTFIGIGISPVTTSGTASQTLPDDQLRALTGGWRNYLSAAGIRPEDMTFLSIL